MKILKSLAVVLALFLGLMVIFLAIMSRQTSDVNAFCNEMKPGLDVHQIPVIARKYDVVPKRVQDPDSISNRTLGSKVGGKADTWFFAVAAPTTMGEHACGVYHDYHVVLSASMGP